MVPPRAQPRLQAERAPVVSRRSNDALNLAADRALALSSALWGVVVLRAVGMLAPSGMEELGGQHVVDGQVNLI